jgi:hypothetical protein
MSWQWTAAAETGAVGPMRDTNCHCAPAIISLEANPAARIAPYAAPPLRTRETTGLTHV